MSRGLLVPLFVNWLTGENRQQGKRNTPRHHERRRQPEGPSEPADLVKDPRVEQQCRELSETDADIVGEILCKEDEQNLLRRRARSQKY